MTSHNICRQLPVIIDGQNFVIYVDTFDLLEGVDIVLGTP